MNFWFVLLELTRGRSFKITQVTQIQTRITFVTTSSYMYFVVTAVLSEIILTHATSVYLYFRQHLLSKALMRWNAYLLGNLCSYPKAPRYPRTVLCCYPKYIVLACGNKVGIGKAIVAFVWLELHVLLVNIWACQCALQLIAYINNVRH